MSADTYTIRHLDAWLDREIQGDACRAEVRAAMLGLVETDPEYWGAQSWWNVFDRVNGQRIRERHGGAMSQRLELRQGQVHVEKKQDLSGAMVKFMVVVRDHGRKARDVIGARTYSVLGHAAESRGLVERIPKSRATTYLLTEAGRQALKEIEP